MADNMQHQSDTVIDDQQHIQYSIDFTRTMTALEAQLHSCEDRRTEGTLWRRVCGLQSCVLFFQWQAD